jgi:hypothetical protein
VVIIKVEEESPCHVEFQLNTVPAGARSFNSQMLLLNWLEQNDVFDNKDRYFERLFQKPDMCTAKRRCNGRARITIKERGMETRRVFTEEPIKYNGNRRRGILLWVIL